MHALPRSVATCGVVFPCLNITGIATSMVNEAKLRAECEEVAPVKRVLILPPPIREQAVVFFNEMRRALRCLRKEDCRRFLQSARMNAP